MDPFRILTRLSPLDYRAKFACRQKNCSGDFVKYVNHGMPAEDPKAQVTLHNDTITCKHAMTGEKNYVGVHTTTKTIK